MKFYNSNLNDLIRIIDKNNVQSILIHGVNNGFGLTAVNQISRKLNLTIRNLDAKDITPEKLCLIANNKNFFNQRELIKITGVNSTINKNMKEILLQKKLYHLICFVASNSLPNSGIRKFFEAEPSLASLGCYYDNEDTIAKLILQQCNKRQKTIDHDALLYLKTYLKGDHQIIRSELEKLFNFTHDQINITKQDILNTLSSDLLISSDRMCIFFAKKQASEFLQEVEKQKQQGINEVLIIRALTRYYLNIYNTTLQLESGENLDKIIKNLTPPIFFKYVPDFRQIVRKFNSDDALRCLNILQESEIKYKTSPKSFDLFSIYNSFYYTIKSM